MYLIKTPLLLKKLYPGLIWNRSRTERCIYLTFDDGPIPIVTPFVLNTLKVYNAKATFFCIGDNIRKHPSVYEQVVADGHTVGNHTYNHLRGWKTDTETYVGNFKKCDEMISPGYFRPPHGRVTREQVKALKTLNPSLNIVMWDVLSGDFDSKLKKEQCLKGVLKHSTNGSIVVFHDSIKAFSRLEYVLPEALKYWNKQGYQFKAL